MIPKLRNEVLRLTPRMSQKQIASELGCHRNTIYRAQKQLGLRARRVLSVAQEKQILDLLQRGMGSGKIGKALSLGEHQVRRVVAKYRFRRRPGEIGYRYHLTPAKRARITEDILRRQDHALPLARKYRVSYKLMLRMVKQVLGCERLTSGRPATPLDSPFPQKWPELFTAARETITAGGVGADLFVRLVDAVLRKSFDGQFPFSQEYDAQFARALLSCFQKLLPGLAAQSQAVIDNFHGGLIEAIHTLRESRDSRWQN